MEQDEEIKKSQKNENSSVALVASGEDEVKDKGKAQDEDTVKLVKEESSGSSKAKGKMIKEVGFDEDNDGIGEHLVFLSWRFSKLKFKKIFNSAEPQRSNSKPDKGMVDRSKFKCFNCGLTDHFANECRKPKTEKKPFENVDYKKKYYELLKQEERALIRKDDWAAEEDSAEKKKNLSILLSWPTL